MVSLRLLSICALVLTEALLAPLGARGACPPQPIAACRSAGRAQLKLDDRADDARDRLVFSYGRGPATAQAEFGSPLTATTISLCVWDDAGTLLALDVPPAGRCAGQPCWTPQADTGFRYDDLAAGQVVRLNGSTKARTRIKLSARGAAMPDPARLPSGSLTVQMLRDDGAICFEAVFPAARVSTKDASYTVAKTASNGALPPLGSAGCGQPLALYTPGTTTTDQLVHDGLTRTFRVYVPASYDPTAPMPVVLLFHGGFGTGAQVEASARITELAASEGFIAVSPDGVPDPTFGIRSWNGGGCCGYAMNSNVDDVGFVRALLDHLEGNACVDRRRVYAEGMSNGAILSHRLACEVADRIRAIGPVAGTNMALSCSPTRPIPIREVHGSADAFFPFGGGLGCGPGGISYASVPDTIEGWRARGGCSDSPRTSLVAGDGTCTGFRRCASGVDVEQCIVAEGGHQWPGGTAPALPGIGSCLFGYQSQSFRASQELWGFFHAHPPR